MEQAQNNQEQTQVKEQVETAEREEPTNKRQAIKQYFTATRIAYIAIFTALSYALRFWEFSLLPAVPFLKLDFSNIFPLIGGFALGPVAGMTIGILKEALWMPFSSTVCAGELANILIMVPFVLIPSIAYKHRKGFKSVLVFISIGCISTVIWSFPVNWLLNFPVFLQFNWQGGMSFFMSVWYWVILFNLIKYVVIDVIVIAVYKSISRLIKLTSEKFENKTKKSD